MALGTIPDWIQVHPSDFVRAASEGAQAGLAVARLNQAADEAATRAAEHGKEFEEAQALRKWEQQQQMQMHAEQMRGAFQKSKDELSARTEYQRSMMEARNAGEKDRQATAAATQKHWQDSLDLQRQRMEGDAGKQSRLQSQETRLEAKSELAGINQRIATVKNQLDKLQVKGSTMTSDEWGAYKSAGQELMGLIDQQTKVQQKYAPPSIAQPPIGSIPPPGPAGAPTPSPMGVPPPTTGSVPPAGPTVAPQTSIPPLTPNTSPGGAVKSSPRDKAIRANALAIANPEWTDEQIKDAVRKEMTQ